MAGSGGGLNEPSRPRQGGKLVLRRFRPRLTFANVISVIALFVALGGGAYAAFHLPRNSVRSRNIVNGQVKSADVKDNSLTGADINESKLADLASGYVTVNVGTPP